MAGRRAGVDAAGADRRRGDRRRGDRRPGGKRSSGLPRDQARRRRGRDALPGRLHRPDAGDDLRVPRWRRHVVQRVASLHDRLGRDRNRSASSTSATRRTAWRRSGRRSCARRWEPCPTRGSWPMRATSWRRATTIGLWGAFVAGLGARAAETPSVPAPGNHDLRPLAVLRCERLRAGRAAALERALRAAGQRPRGASRPRRSELLRRLPGPPHRGAGCERVRQSATSSRSSARGCRTRRSKWLRRVLDTNPHRWTVVVQHQPVYSVTKDRDSAAMRAALGAVYDRYHVDLVLQGHDHAYARTHKVNGGRPAGRRRPGRSTRSRCRDRRCTRLPTGGSR